MRSTTARAAEPIARHLKERGGFAATRSREAGTSHRAKRAAFRAEPLGGFDVHDLELQLAARRGDFDGLALLAAHDRLADRRLVRELVRGRIGFGGPDDVVLDGLAGLHVAQADLGPDRDLAGLDLLLGHDARVLQALLEHRDAGLEMGLLVLGRVVLGVLGDVAELARSTDAVRDVAAPVYGQVLDLGLELLEALGRENDFLQLVLLKDPGGEKTAGGWASGGGGWYLRLPGSSTGVGLPSPHERGTARILADRAGRAADQGRARPHGRRERPGLPPPGPPLRG